MRLHLTTGITSQHRFRVFSAAVLLFTCLTCVHISQAQIRSSTITGLVTDKSGAVVPEVQVAVTDEETQVTGIYKTDSEGKFTAPYLAPGRYSVSAEKQGFSVFKETGVLLGTGQQVRVDIELQLGTVGATVQVQADALMLQTESTSVEGRVGSRVIEAVPEAWMPPT